MIIQPYNKKIYQTVYQQKTLTEHVLGTVSYSFPFVKARYKAICTEAVDFTLFDKVICGILQIDEVLNFEEIADILGLNVVHRPDEGRYIDYGEKEILESALDSLVEFKMLEKGDVYYSRCRLTELGKTYAAQGKKSLPAKEKNFDLYFDLTDLEHTQAKKRFGKMDAISSQNCNWAFDTEDEELVKEIAKTQVPDIYNPDQLCYFTDLESIDVNSYEATFELVILLSFVENTLRFLAFDAQQKIQPSITALIHSNEALKASILNQFDWGNYQLNEKPEVQKAYERQAIEVQNDIERLIAKKKTKEAFQKSKAFYLQSEVFDHAFLELYLDAIFDTESKEFWIVLSELDEPAFSNIEAIIHNKLSSQQCLFIIVPSDISMEYQKVLQHYTQNNRSVFVGMEQAVEQSFFLSKKGNQKWALLQQTITTPVMQQGALKKVEKEVFIKTPTWNADITTTYKNYKSALAAANLKTIKTTVKTELEKFSKTPKDISNAALQNLTSTIKQLHVFKNVKNLRDAIDTFCKESQQHIEHIKTIHHTNLALQLHALKQQLEVRDTVLTTLELQNLEEAAALLLHEIDQEQTALQSKCKTVLTTIKTQIKQLHQAKSKSKRKKSYNN